MRLMEAVRGRKGPPDGITLGPTGTWAPVEAGKGGERDGGRKAQDCARNYFGPPGTGGKCSRVVAAGGRGRRPCRPSLHARARGGGEKRSVVIY